MQESGTFCISCFQTAWRRKTCLLVRKKCVRYFWDTLYFGTEAFCFSLFNFSLVLHKWSLTTNCMDICCLKWLYAVGMLLLYTDVYHRMAALS